MSQVDPIREINDTFATILQDTPEAAELGRYLISRLLDLACTTKDHEYAVIAAAQVENIADRAERAGRERRRLSPGEWAGHAFTVTAFLSGGIVLVAIALWFAHWCLPFLFGQ